jgi:hypothetical protein
MEIKYQRETRFILYYQCSTRQERSECWCQRHLHQRVLLLVEHTQPESPAAEIKLTVETTLHRRYSIRISDILCANIALTTDWTAFMHRIADRSESFSKFELDEGWLVCGAYQVDSILKT